MAADASGHIYVVKMEGEIVQITPDGVQSVLAEQGFHVQLISSINFGPGFGGCEEGRIYVMDLQWRGDEIDVGIPGKWEPHW